MRILHVVPGLDEAGNGIAVAAKLVAGGQRDAGDEVELLGTPDFLSARDGGFDEVWVHSMWRLATLRACRKVLSTPAALVRMTHGCLDPVRLRYHGWRKRLVTPAERWLFRRAARVVATCAAEAEWNRRWLGADGRPSEIVDLKRFFDLGAGGGETAAAGGGSRDLRVLYVGRRHPLKGVRYLARAIEELNGEAARVSLRLVSDHFGAELERDWAWCDVLCLPTLSENFGLVVAEALARGKRVVTTDGAPAWAPGAGAVPPARLTYVRGYRDGTDARRVRLLKGAIGRLCGLLV